jgi:hypothetical protein
MQIGQGISLGSGLQLYPDPAIVNFITNGLILNLDAGISSSYPGSGNSWNDISGLNNNFSFSSGAPTFASAGNQSYFYFGNVASGGSILPATAYTKVAIFQVTGTFGNIISGGFTGTDHAFWGAGSQYLQSGHNGNWSTVVSPIITPANQWVFGAVSFNTTTGWRLYLGTNTPVTNSDTSTFSPDPAGVEIGGYQGNANNMNGDVAAALVYNRVLSDTEISTLHTYYQSRFTGLY